jgi:hypothetical protein
MQGYKVYLLTIIIAFFAGVESLKALALPHQLFLPCLSFLAGLLLAGVVFFLSKAEWFGQLVRDAIRKDWPKDRPEYANQHMLHQVDHLINPDQLEPKGWLEKQMIRVGGSDELLLIVSVSAGMLVSLVILLALALAGI